MSTIINGFNDMNNDGTIMTECSQCGMEGELSCAGCKEVYYCSRDHQRIHWSLHKPFCRSYGITTHSEMGEYLVASRRMVPGYLFLTEEPLIEGPLSTCTPVCLGCHVSLPQENHYSCPDCDWPMCSYECTQRLIHRRECHILARDGKKIGVPLNYDETPRYDIIMILRGLLLRDHDSNAWKCIMEMESHSKIREKLKEPHHIATVRYLIEVCEVDYDLVTVQHVRGAIVTNGMEIRSKMGGRIRAVYPKIRLLNHSCIPNVHLTCTASGIMEARSAVTIEKSETLYICYTGTVEPVWERQNCAQQTYNFVCSCERCADPTELGTYFSSPRCPDCPGKYLLPFQNKVRTRWQCLRCETEYNMNEVQQEIDEWTSRLQMIDTFGSKTPKQVMKVISNVENAFHSNHFIYLRSAHTAIELLNTDNSLESLDVRKILWLKILKIYDTLEPGLTRRRGMTLFETGRTILNYLKRAKEEENLSQSFCEQQIQEAIKYLQEAREIFILEPKENPESKFYRRTCELLQQDNLRHYG